MPHRFDVMIAGHLCLDLIPRLPEAGSDIAQILRPGKLLNVGGLAISTGGPVSNTGLNLKKLGTAVCFCARVGQDRIARLTTDVLSAHGNIDGLKQAAGVDSSYTVVLAPPGIDRIFLHNPGANDTFGPEDLNPDQIAQCRHFHFGYPPLMRRMFEGEGEELTEIFRIAKRAGATTSCDMTLPDPASPSGQAPWRRILEKLLPHVDLFLPSIEETLYMLDPGRFMALKQAHANAELIDHLTPDDYSQLADQVLAMGAKLVSLKSGHRGFYVKTATAGQWDGLGAARPGDAANWAGRELWAPAFAVERVASATGSGDSSIAGLLSAFLRGEGIESALRYATALGWQNVQVLDAVSGARSWEETTQWLATRTDHIDPHLEGVQGWRWDANERLWHGPDEEQQ